MLIRVFATVYVTFNACARIIPPSDLTCIPARSHVSD